MLGGLVYLARALIAAFAVLLIGGHNLFDALRAEDLKAWGALGDPATGEDIALTSTLTIDPFYPLVPWVGVMALGMPSALCCRKEHHGGFCSAWHDVHRGVCPVARVKRLRDPEPWSAPPSALVTVYPTAMNKVAYSICFASDMAGFTTIAETMNPRDLALFLNDYFATLAEPLKRHKVDVTEFRADGVMCAWLAAQAEASVHRKAILAALEAVEAVARFKERHALRWHPLRIGLEAGTVYVGHAGGGGHFVYSIVGDCANTAARVEGLNKHLGTQLLATQAVVDGFDKLLLRPLGEFCFVGKSEPLPIVEILPLNGAASEAEILLCERFAEALNMLRTEQWAKAADCFAAILRDHPDDGPARFHLARCRRYQQASPPPEAPLIIRMDSK